MKNTIFALLNLLTVWLMPFLALGQSAGLESRQPTPGSLGNVSISANIGFIRTLFPDYEFYSNYKHTLYPELEVDTEMMVPYIRRSEEHTSELQSRGHLVCRLLL